jgi:hypothetical protein
MNGNYKLLLEALLFTLAIIAVYGSSFMFRDDDAAAQTSGDDNV